MRQGCGAWPPLSEGSQLPDLHGALSHKENFTRQMRLKRGGIKTLHVRIVQRLGIVGRLGQLPNPVLDVWNQSRQAWHLLCEPLSLCGKISDCHGQAVDHPATVKPRTPHSIGGMLPSAVRNPGFHQRQIFCESSGARQVSPLAEKPDPVPAQRSPPDFLSAP